MKNKILYIVIILAVAVVTGAIFFGHSNQNTQQTPATNGSKSGAEQFSGFSLKDYSGKVVTSAQFQGKPLIINSWASWCPFCKVELPAFADAQDQFKNQIVTIAVDRGEPLGVAKQYSDSQGVTGRLVFLLDPSDSFYKSIGGFSMPETIFVNKNGAIAFHKRGPMDASGIKEKIQQMLSQ